MNNKKFIALLSAAALAASSFASLAVYADGETVLYSDNFNGYATSAKEADGIVFATTCGSDYDSVVGNEDWQWIFNSPGTHAIDKLLVEYDGTRGDDTGAVMINEKEDAADKYLMLPQNRFQSRCKPMLTGFNNYTANEGEELVIDFKAKLTEGEQGATSLSLGDLGTLTTADLGTDTWTEVKLITNAEGTSIYAGGKFINEVGGAVLEKIQATPFDADTKCNTGVYAAVNIDDIVILSAPNGLEAVIPNAETQGEEPAATDDPADDKPAAELEGETQVIDFLDVTLEDGSIVLTNHESYTTVNDMDADPLDDTNAVLSAVQTSSKTNSFGYAKLDFSSLTTGKSHIVVDYDFYAGADGRIKVILDDENALTAENTDSLSSLISQGITKSGESGIVNCKVNEWVHTTVDVNLAAGTGTYEVTSKADGSAFRSGKITTDLRALTTLSLVSWSPNTSYIDNLQIKWGGELEATPEPEVTEAPPAATAEPASEQEGSGIALTPDDARDTFDASAIQGTATVVLNHSEAKPAVAASVETYSEKAKGYSIYAAYDVYVAAGDKLTLEAYGDSGKALGTTFVLTGNADGTATATALVDKGDTVNVGTVANKTWYRVVIEVPQTSEGTTGNATYTIYRINPENPEEILEVAAQKDGLTPRNLSGRGMTSLAAKVEGTPYIDNVALYLGKTSGEPEATEQPPAADVTPEPASEEEGSNINLTPEDVRVPFDAAAIQGTATVVLNHSEAKPAVAASVETYSEKAKGYSIYAAYDVYVAAGDKLTLEAYGDSGKALGTTFVLTGNADGTATATALVDKGDTVNVGTVANKTWYRVVIEVPQTSEGTTGNATYTIYRINPENPTETLGVAAQKDGLTPRNLSGRGMTSLAVKVEGTPYIDNVAVYLAKTNVPAKDVWTKYEVDYDANGRILSVVSEAVEDPSTVDTTGNSELFKTFVWNALQQPYEAE